MSYDKSDYVKQLLTDDWSREPLGAGDGKVIGGLRTLASEIGIPGG